MVTKLSYNIKHSLPGRLRVALPSLISQKESILCIKAYFSGIRGVTRVITNHHSGSVTIWHDPEIMGENDLCHMLDNITREELLRMSEQMPKSNEEKSPQKPPSGSDTGMWKLAGRCLGGIGMVSLLLPVLPGIPLLVLAAYCKERANGTTT